MAAIRQDNGDVAARLGRNRAVTSGHDGRITGWREKHLQAHACPDGFILARKGHPFDQAQGGPPGAAANSDPAAGIGAGGGVALAVAPFVNGWWEQRGQSVIGHLSNLLGVPMELLVHRDYNDYPMPLHISGVREMNATLFEMLAQSSDLGDAGEAFTCYMMAMFGIDPEQREDGAGQATGARRRRYRSSFLRLIKGWGYDSNGPEGAVLKGWVESRFGIFPTFHKEVIRRISSRAWTTYVEEKMSSRFHSNSIYTQLDLLFEFCQWALARMVAPGRTHLTLYRGINAFDEHQLVERIDRRTARMRLDNLSSFTSHRDIAECFGDTILTVQVPVAKVAFFNTLLSAHPLKGEGEVLVIGGEYRVTASYL